MTAAIDAGRETLLFAGRTVRRFNRSRPLLISALIFPLIMLFTQVVAFSKLAGDAFGGHYAQHFAPLALLTTASFAASGSATGLFEDLRSGLFSRLRTMPIRPVSLMTGRVLGDLFRILIVGAVAAAAAQLTGFRFESGIVPAVGFFAVFLLFGIMVTSVAVTVALYCQSISQIQLALGNPTTLLYLLSTGFVPLTAFPEQLRPLVHANPMSVFTQTLVGLSAGGPVAAPLLGAVAWAAVVCLGCWVAAISRYGRLARR